MSVSVICHLQLYQGLNSRRQIDREFMEELKLFNEKGEKDCSKPK